jgi:AraC-like DNA-binding protein
MHQGRDVVVASDPDYEVEAFSCLDDHTGWFGDYQTVHQLMLVRRGRFRVRSEGAVFDVDPTSCFLGVPGQTRQFAHPPTGEVSTLVSISPALWRSMAGDARLSPPCRHRVYADARMELAHRWVLAALPDPGYALIERLLGLLAEVVARSVIGGTPLRDRPLPAVDRQLVERARQAIQADDPAAARLGSLAAQLGCSPYRLSRAFSREVGVSITHYRNRVRMTRAMDRLEGGESSLAVLAADLGFADQSHLTRTVREQLGHTPTALRRLLAS